MAGAKATSARRSFGFRRADTLLQGRIRDASASRGFAQSRVLTQWAEIAGPQIAQIARPVEISYGRGGMGATLVLLTIGAHAPMLEMETPKLRERVNAVYGYNAVSRIRITQTAPTGFAEGQAVFSPATPSIRSPDAAPAEVRAQAAQQVAPIGDPGLREALERLATHVITKNT